MKLRFFFILFFTFFLFAICNKSTSAATDPLAELFMKLGGASSTESAEVKKVETNNSSESSGGVNIGHKRYQRKKEVLIKNNELKDNKIVKTENNVTSAQVNSQETFYNKAEIKGANQTKAENNVTSTQINSQETFHNNAEIKDTIPPENVTNFKAKYSKKDENNYDVKLNWTSSKNTANDLDHYNYYQKKDYQSFLKAIIINKDKTSYQTTLPSGKRYTFKISTVDKSGNESTGAITSIILPNTGPEALLLIIGVISSLLTYSFIRK